MSDDGQARALDIRLWSRRTDFPLACGFLAIQAVVGGIGFLVVAFGSVGPGPCASSTGACDFALAHLGLSLYVGVVAGMLVVAFAASVWLRAHAHSSAWVAVVAIIFTIVAGIAALLVRDVALDFAAY